MAQTFESITQSEIHDFIHNPISVADGYQFSQYENVRKTHLYLNSQFYGANSTGTNEPLVDGLSDNTQDDRIFFNITVPRVRAVKRFFDVDPADVVLDEIDPQSEIAIQFLNKEFDRKALVPDKKGDTLAADFNRFKNPLIEYGSVAVEIMDNADPYIIPLQRYFLDPSVERSINSRFNTIKYIMTPDMLRKKVAEGWNAEAVEEIIAKHCEKSDTIASYEGGTRTNIGSTQLIEVYKRYGYVPKYALEGGYDTTEVFTMAITAFGPDSVKKGKDASDCITLFSTEWTSDFPIIDHHINKTHGRWQGIGVPELLYPFQQRMNEICNQKRISMEISSIHLFQTADPTTLNNILSDLENGDVIQTKTPGAISPIATEERNLPAFESEIVTYSTGADKITFANDLLAGGDIASSTPATNVVVQNNNQALVHLQDREEFTTWLADNYIKKFVVPQLIKDASDEHFLRIVSEPSDLLQLDEMIVDVQFNQFVLDEAIKSGREVSLFEAEEIRNDMFRKLRSGGPNRYVKVVKDYYKNKLGDIMVLIGNDRKDVAKIANNTLSFFQVLQNPAVLDDPVARVFATNYARDIGIDTAEMEVAFAKRDGLASNPQQSVKGVPDAQPQIGQPTEEEELAIVQ